jgi:hypothetical protein
MVPGSLALTWRVSAAPALTVRSLGTVTVGGSGSMVTARVTRRTRPEASVMHAATVWVPALGKVAVASVPLAEGSARKV